MTDPTESLIREAFAAEADRAPDPRPVLAAVAAGRRRRRPAFAVVVAAAVVAVAAVVVPQVMQRSAPAPSGSPTGVTPQTILLVGTDPRGLADAIMLAHLNDDGTGVVLSLPRDSYVEVPGHGMNRLNQVDQEFGTDALLDTVGDLTGLAVDHYAILPMDSFAAVSEAVGGVPVCVRVPTRDPITGAVWAKGTHTVAGQNALAYLRQRHGLYNGELDRIVRQQAFLDGLARSLTEGEADLGTLLEAVTREARLDPGWDLVGAASELANVRPADIRFGTIPVADPSFTAPNGAAVLRVDPGQVRTFVAAAVDGQAAQPSPKPASGAPVTDVGCVS